MALFLCFVYDTAIPVKKGTARRQAPCRQTGKVLAAHRARLPAAGEYEYCVRSVGGAVYQQTGEEKVGRGRTGRSRLREGEAMAWSHGKAWHSMRTHARLCIHAVRCGAGATAVRVRVQSNPVERCTHVKIFWQCGTEPLPLCSLSVSCSVVLLYWGCCSQRGRAGLGLLGAPRCQLRLQPRHLGEERGALLLGGGRALAHLA